MGNGILRALCVGGGMAMLCRRFRHAVGRGRAHVPRVACSRHFSGQCPAAIVSLLAFAPALASPGVDTVGADDAMVPGSAVLLPCLR